MQATTREVGAGERRLAVELSVALGVDVPFIATNEPPVVIINNIDPTLHRCQAEPDHQI
jgi:hypothetical protein